MKFNVCHGDYSGHGTCWRSVERFKFAMHKLNLCNQQTLVIHCSWIAMFGHALVHVVLPKRMVQNHLWNTLS